MPRKKKGEVWWLANGHSQRSRQPSFAPPTARPSITHSSYAFGWCRKRQCFVTSQSHGLLSPAMVKTYPCDPNVALSMLRRCAYKNVRTRFFDNPYAKEGDAELFAASGHMFGITLNKRHWGHSYNTNAEANLHFYGPDGQLYRISFHNGMTKSFNASVAGKKVDDIARLMK